MNLFKKSIKIIMLCAIMFVLSSHTGQIIAGAASESGMEEGLTKKDLYISYGTTCGEEENFSRIYVDVTDKTKEVLVNFPLVKKSGNTDQPIYTVKEKTWDVYEVVDGCVHIVIDLSVLNPLKENYVEIKTTDKPKPILIHFPAAEKSIKATYDAKEKIVSFKTASNQAFTGDMVYKTNNGYWMPYTNKDGISEDGKTILWEKTDLSLYEEQGATLYFRQGDVGFFYDENENRSYSCLEDEKSKIEGYTLYNASNFPGKEIKVKIKKRANAPSVKIDSRNKTFTIKKGCEYRFNYGPWSETATEDLLIPLEKENGAYVPGVLEVRKSAVDGTKYVPESKIRRLEYDNMGTIVSKDGIQSKESINGQSLTTDEILIDVSGSMDGIGSPFLHIVVTDESKEVLVNFPTVKKSGDAKHPDYLIKEKAWDVYDVKERAKKTWGGDTCVTVDLSALNPAKENYVAIKTVEKSKPVLLYFPAVEKAPKGIYDAKEKAINFKTASNEIFTEDMQYRTPWGEYGYTYRNQDTMVKELWDDSYFEDPKTDLSLYEQQGTTIYFRQRATDDEGINEMGMLSPKKEDVNLQGYTFYKTGHFAGKEIKVKIKKLANGPSVKVDYANKTFTVKKGCEYRFNYGAWSETLTSDMVLTLPKDNNGKYSAGVLEVRKSAVDGAKYTPKSKITRIEYEGVKDLQRTGMEGFTGVDVDWWGDSMPLITEDGTVTDGDILTEDNKSVVITMKPDFIDIGDSLFLESLNLTLTNTSKYTFEIVVTDSKMPTINSGNVKGIKKLGAATQSGSKSITLKKCIGKYIYIRYAADKKTGTWRSDFELLTFVTDDKEIRTRDKD